MRSPAKTETRQRPTLAEPIRADCLYSAKQAMAALSWSWRALWEAQRRGLRIVKFRQKSYVLGSDILRFFEQLPAPAGPPRPAKGDYTPGQ